MTANELFDALENIDDKLIAGAKKPRRNLPLKIAGAAAACLAVIAAVGIFAANFDKIRSLVRDDPDLSESDQSNSNKHAEFPKQAKYKYEGDFSELELVCSATVDRFAYNTFSELAYNSELIVLGTFVDDARQDAPLSGRTNDPPDGHASFSSYNKLRIDKVFKGSAAEGDEIIIRDSYYVNGGELNYVNWGSLTPMINGEQWVYFLKKGYPEYGDYYNILGSSDGRFPVPGNENSFVLTDNNYGVYEERQFKTEGYEDVKIMLGQKPAVEQVMFEGYTIPADTFVMPEFPADTFSFDIDMYVSRDSSKSLLFGAKGGVTNVYLADLNGDGKREVVCRCYNGLSGLAAYYITVYDNVNSLQYELRGELYESYSLEIRDGVLYAVKYSNGAHTEQLSAMPLTLDMLEAVNIPENETFYKGTRYTLANRKTFDDGVELSVWLTKQEYEVGENVKLLAVVKNGSDKPIGLLTPTQGGDYRYEFHYNISLDNEKLHELYMGDITGLFIGIDCAMGKTVLQPGESFSHVQWFDTQKETFNSEGSIKPMYKPLGDYKGSVGITQLGESEDTGSRGTARNVDFSVRLVQRNDLDARGNFFKKFTMYEFPNVEFTCTENSVSALEDGKNTVLFDGVQIDTLYLYDLDGDGKRELCSSANFGSGIVDYRIMVYDFANKKLYRLSDRGYYDYHLVSVLGYGDSYNLYYEKYKYATTNEVYNEPLTLDRMTEIENRQPDTRELIKGVTEIIKSPEEIGDGQFFAMEEFPGTVFYIYKNSLTAVSNYLSKDQITAYTDKGPERQLYSEEIESVYLYDLNADGRREIIIVGWYKWNIYDDPPKKMITFLDYENWSGESLFCKKDPDEPDYYSLIIENGELYISAGGEVLPEPVTYDKVIELIRS